MVIKVKRIAVLLLTVIMVLLLLPANAYAASDLLETQVVKVQRFTDGSYLVITMQTIETYASGTKTGTDTYTYYSASNEISWKAVLTGTFTYNGTTATCTSSSCNVTVYNNNWYVISKSVSKNANAAIGTVTMGYKFLGVTVKRDTYDLSLSCDPNGNLGP